MMVESCSLAEGLRQIGRAMSRQKYQRPTVYATGKREKLWKVEYREYFLDADGKERSGTGRRLGAGRTTRKQRRRRFAIRCYARCGREDQRLTAE